MKNFEIENVFLNEVDSTQKYAKENFLNFDREKITCVYTFDQKKGYGRFQRAWQCPKEKALAATFYFQIENNFKAIENISHLMALSTIALLEKFNLNPKIKWPNDILINDKKMAGIICETIFEKDSKKVNIFLGIGMNINLDENDLESIDQPFTSMKIETGKIWDIQIILQELENIFIKNIDIFLKEGFSAFFNRYNHYLAFKNKDISFFDGQNTYKGKLLSITEEGKLKILLKNGREKTFFSGDIT